jgi:putative sigma-54 modulation protein
MNTTIVGRHMDISPALHDRVDKKMKKLDKYFGPNTEAHVIMHVEKNRHVMETTIVFEGITFRGEESSSNMYKSIDSVVKKIEKQIHHHRSKLEKRLRSGAFNEDAYDEPIEDLEEVAPYKLVKTKKFPVKPIDLEEATMQMQLVGHNFFVFRNAETNQVNVLYRRNDGDLGLIEPEY